jgi:hypothetical protein
MQALLRDSIAHCSVETVLDRGSLMRYFNSPVHFSLRDEIVKVSQTAVVACMLHSHTGHS